jgi:tetratricopeptide (TPR) repeat protein
VKALTLWRRMASCWAVSNRPLHAEQARPGSADEIGAQLAKLPHWVAYLLLCLLMAACSTAPQPARRRLLVLRFENLTGDPALDWMGRGATRQIAAQIEGAGIADAGPPEPERERAIVGGATRILHGYLARAGDHLRLQADLEDAASAKFPQSAEATGLVSAGLLPLSESVAHQLDPTAHPAGAKNDAALAAYIAGLSTSDGTAAVESLSRSIAADPDFGAAYLAIIEYSQARGDRAAAERFLALARARREAITAVDRARLNVAAAQLSGNSAALSQSLAALSRLTPGDANLLRSLGGVELQARRYGPAIDYYKKALAAQPNDSAALNLLGYTQAYAGDLEGAIKTLREYQRVRPTDANPVDSLGDVNFYLGQFSEAEKFYRQEYSKDPAFLNGASLIKAATAHLMTGDIPGAEAIFVEYEAARRAGNDPMIGFTRAEWDYFRGKHTEAIGNLENLAGAMKIRDLASLGHSTVAVWLLEAGDRERARQQAAQAVSTAGQATAALAAAARFMAEPAGGQFPDPLVRAYALLLSRNFTAAIPLLREIVARSAPTPNETTPVFLAWALVETGAFDEAAKYLRSTPVPSVSGQAPFDALIFPRIFYLRAVVAEKKGLKQVAAQNYQLFKTLSGPKT